MAERFVGIDVALREHRIAVLDRDGEAVGPSFTIAASTDGVTTLLRTLDARAATAAQTLIGLEARATSGKPSKRRSSARATASSC